MSLQPRCTAHSLVSGERCELPAGHMGMHTEAAGVPFLTAEESAELPPESEGYEMSPQEREALHRAIPLALYVFGTTAAPLVGVVAAGQAPWWTLLITPLLAGFIAGVKRYIEGWLDGKRAEEGRMIEADVRPLPPVRVPRTRR